MDKRFLGFIFTLLVIAALSWAIILFARGYRFKSKGTGTMVPSFQKTGMLMAKSYPDGAKLYVDNNLKGPTNLSVSDLSPGTHQLKIVKDGYFEYSKQVEIFEELVTIVDALLMPLSPSLTPLTYNGVQTISLSPSGETAVFVSLRDGEPGGIWKLPLNSRPQLLVSNSMGINFTNASSIVWSPTENEVLVKVGAQYYLLSLDLPNLSLVPREAEPILKTWEQSGREHEELRLKKLDIPESMVRVATDSATHWSPDKKRFIYQAFDPELQDYQTHTYTLEKPRPIGGKDDYLSYEYAKDSKVKVLWYGDSQHLILAEEGKLYLVEIDGSNKTLLFSGVFDSNAVYAKPGGGGVIILTKFNEDAPENLYLISI